ncbi:MAG TPA: iron-containing alcohol dehydrogenase family protein [Ramlibacter sp.]
MRAFRHLAAPLRLFHGDGCLAALGPELDRVGSRRAVVFCGASLARQTAVMDAIRDAMGERFAGLHDLVVAHSPLDRVLEGTEFLRRTGADAVLAVGGGSAVVTARAASILLAEGRDARALSTARGADGRLHSPRLLKPKLPQLVLPTTPTTATVKAGSAILDPHSGGRLALFDPNTRAKAVFIDAGLLATPPAALVTSASLNTLAMAVEGLLSRSGDAFSDGLLIHALRLLALNAPLLRTKDSVAVRSELMMASLLCGHGTDFTGAGIAIPLGHAISARFQVDNGLANAIVLPSVLRFNAAHAAAGLQKLGTALDVPLHGLPPEATAEALVDRLLQVLAPFGVPRRLRDIGVTQASLGSLAEVSADDWFARDNPRVASAAELADVLGQAW